MRIIAVTNIKGGVGKTTTAVNLAFLCAAGGHATLLWDLDPQGAATFTLRCEPAENVSAKKLTGGQRNLPELVLPCGHERLDNIMKIIAVTNIKGGVGKTTTAVNLAFLCAAGGHATLLWDLDPQGAATFILRCEPAEQVSAKKLVGGKRNLPELVLPSGHERLDVLPSDFSYRNFDLHLNKRKHPTERLLKMSGSLRDVYAALFLDCPPGISLLSENVLRAADALIVPLLPTPLSVRMLRQLYEFIAASGWTDVALLPFFSMVDRRRSLHHEVITSTRAEFPAVLNTEIPYSSDIERMSLRRAPIPAYAPKSPTGQIYLTLWEEIAARLHWR